MTSGRRFLFVLVICTFVVQTSLVYVDDSGYRTPRLSSKAQTGRRLWHENNCQSCHQIYGFGGFLGPDLTNAAQYMANERMQSILTVGMPPMPAFHFDSREIEALSSFLTEVDATGTGQFRFIATPSDAEVLDQVVDTVGSNHPLSAQSETGYQLVSNRKCIGCHLPNPQSTKQAPDLCDVIVSPGEDGIAITLRYGRFNRGMPQFALSTDEVSAVVAFLRWMHENRTEIRTEFKSILNRNAEGARIPWFEYDK